MTNEQYAEEQANEIEILQSIYPAELELLSTNPHSFSITIPVDEEDVRPCTLQLAVTYTAQYPDELPDFSITLKDQDDAPPLAETDAELAASDLDDLTAATRALAEDTRGMAMVFAMASNLREIAGQRLVQKTDDLKRKRELRIQKEIEADQAKFVGTPVTPENFAEWKRRFDQEMEAETAGAEEGADERGVRRAGRAEGKLTGRQLFEQNQDLATSDSSYVNDGDTSVDASSFSRQPDQSDSD
ncbi:rwd domain-containing protein [Coemansia sp. RSA 2611]|nr:rwd domain-containing protein [Coemansia sp. RSA 2610]KAJ2382497.1 rwd domain-containing protein [Coemansia sp. RSA 2611]